MPTETQDRELPSTDLHIAALGLLSLDATQPPPPSLDRPAGTPQTPYAPR